MRLRDNPNVLKRLLNHSEEVTNERLRSVCTPHSVSVYAKVRLADVLPIDGSGIDDRAYTFALKSHFDFTVVDNDYTPLFAVEFDGPQHEFEAQLSRDDLKDSLCRRFGLPLLRIDDRFLEPRYMDMDLLSWLVGVVLTRRANYEMVRAGELAPEDAASSDPIFCAPFVISCAARKQIDDWNDQDLIDRYPPFIIGVDDHENAYALGAVRLKCGSYAVATAEMPYQGFFQLAEDLLEEILYIKLAAVTATVLEGRH
jgi:hypothetical protein